jgi:HNH endonuclease
MTKVYRYTKPATCKHCKKPFEAKRSMGKAREATGGQKYCSQRCYWDANTFLSADRICCVCGAAFTNKRRITCSDKCRRLRAAQKKSDSGRVMVPCEHCQVPVRVVASKAKRQERIFCSKKCFGLHSTANKSYLKECTCKGCNKVFSIRQDHPGIYCSLACYRQHEVKKHGVNCDWCGQEFILHNYRIQSLQYRFCSKDCYRKGYSGERHHGWCGGKSFEPYPSSFNEQFKQQIRSRDNWHCQLCGLSQEDNGFGLSVHHIDYEKDNLDPENLISLCRSCHGQTNQPRDHWPLLFQSIRRRVLSASPG